MRQGCNKQRKDIIEEDGLSKGDDDEGARQWEGDKTIIMLFDISLPSLYRKFN